MYNGKVKGMMAFGMNGVMIGQINKNINALKKAHGWQRLAKLIRIETSELANSGTSQPTSKKPSIRRFTGYRVRASRKKTAA